MASIDLDRAPTAKPARGPLVYRQRVLTRVTHWVWAVALFFLLLSGLQIFTARPDLYVGQESGFEYDNAVLSIGARQVEGEVRGFTRLGPWEWDTTGTLGAIGGERNILPNWMTIPSYTDLGTGRVVHFFFAWVLFLTLAVWGLASLLNGHLRELVPTPSDLRALPGDLLNHARLRLHRTHKYNVLQKLTYAGVLFVLFPLMFLTGLSMSPNFNASAPWLLDAFGGRQTARTIHFVVMILLLGFFAVHILMVLLAGPFNEMRSMVTGWYRVDPDGDAPDNPRQARPTKDAR